MEERGKKLHVLVIPYPTQGHVNPMLQFCNRLASKGVATTVAVSTFIFNTFKPQSGIGIGIGIGSSGSVEWDTISDGFDDGGFAAASSIEEYLVQVETAGSRTLTELLRRRRSSGRPIHAIVYDSFMPWALDVAKDFGLAAAPFFTQPSAVNLIYYFFHKGLLKVSDDSSAAVLVPGLPPLRPPEMPSFIYVAGSYPQYFHLVLNQWLNVQKADWFIVNSVFELEPQAVEEMSKIGPTLTIGPTIPSFYIDNHNENDKKYELNLFPFKPEDESSTKKWLETKPKASVIYMSFGSLSNLSIAQMAELAAGLAESNCFFIWVVRESEETKIPKDFVTEKGLILKWCSQIEVLSNEAIGCFFTHCGWNSTLETLCVGVPIVSMPQWTDQPTITKYVEDVWKVGVRVKVGEDGIVGKEEIKACIRTVMEGDRAIEFKENALKWKQVVLQALGEGGSSMKNIDQLISSLREKISD